MEATKKSSSLCLFGWLNSGLLALLLGLGVVFKHTASAASSSSALTTVILLLCVMVVANAFLFFRALLHRQVLPAVLSLLVAGGVFLLVGGILGGITVGSLGK